MRQIQPVGPYAIVGYSYGGNLAVEVSRQLISHGQSIELAVVLDAYAPGALRDTAPPRPIETQTQRLKRHFEILIRSKSSPSLGVHFVASSYFKNMHTLHERGRQLSRCRVPGPNRACEGGQPGRLDRGR